MKRVFSIFILALFIASLTTTPLFCKKVKLDGTWVGSTVIPTGEELPLTLVLKKIKKKQYSGTLSDASGMLQEAELKNVKYKKKKLTCYIDFQGTKINIELNVEKGGHLTGAWLKEDDGSAGDFEFKKEQK
ncbi:MAG: hypothetical protein KAT34_19590, partial [Candidatus Aminicenantes bacterium]|jgi:hypothetical protein|nr:hypothetical protein [Candidatus Aminicenantes bacterium]